MRITEERSVSTKVLVDVLCDRCDAPVSPHGIVQGVYGIEFVVSGGYCSTHFPDDGFESDGSPVVNVCEKCAAEWFKSFKRNPLNRSCEES